MSIVKLKEQMKNIFKNNKLTLGISGFQDSGLDGTKTPSSRMTLRFPISTNNL